MSTRLFVAYNESGDLVATGYSYADLLRALDRKGYEEEEVLIGTVTL